MEHGSNVVSENSNHPMLPRKHVQRVNPHAATDPLPLNEAAKLELASLPSKTPVSILQELLSRRGLTPKYELVQIEGAIHEPTFRYRVTLDNSIAVGTGRSKKEAKHAAAKALLDVFVGYATENTNNEEGISNGTSQEGATNSLSVYEDKVMGNPIGWLQEMCMSRRWPPPFYDMESEEGPPHERMFTIVCQVFKHKEIGTGKSKKLAKRQAAHKMWQTLQDITINENHVDTHVEDEAESNKKVEKFISRYADLKDSKISTVTPLFSNKVTQFHQHLKSCNGKKLSQLQTTSLNNNLFNFVQFLQEIATEQEFEVTFVDIEEKSISGQCQCLVQLSTLPVAVCCGMGATSKDAQSNAAQNALEYIKIMTKK